ncbi:hypothetical protein MBLNU230_g5563t1 [Neophaeotheca triangularis]
MSPPTSTSKNAAMQRADDFIDFLNASPTPFHAVRSSYQRLEAAGFTRIHESASWASTLKPGGKYYLTRNASTIIAFTVGQQWKPGNPIAMVGAHTDSPCLRIKPVSKRTSDGFLQVGVETYGGGWWATWFDRDLSVAGRVMVQKKGQDKVEQKLVRINKPICRIPNLAVHFGGSVPFEFNKETQLQPIAGMVAAELNRTGEAPDTAKTDEAEDTPFQPLKPTTTRHHPRLIQLLAAEASCDPSEILDLECVLYDTQPACLGGLNDELVFSARLDNLGMTYCAVEGLIASTQTTTNPSSLQTDPTIRLIACFDHEEIGSTSAQGAASNILPQILSRLTTLPIAPSTPSSETTTSSSSPPPHPTPADTHAQSLSRSLLLSADMAHSINPNYTAKHESQHQPLLNAGPVLKINANVRYATNSPGITLLHRAAAAAKPPTITPPGSPAAAAAKAGKGVPLQLFVVRNDSPCGSTIGPMLSASLGVRTVDLGNPQLSMHSIREVGGAWDVELGVNLFESFFVGYGEWEGVVGVVGEEAE